MTPEELLRKRYKVIALYPGSIWQLGEIFNYTNYNCYSTDLHPSCPIHESMLQKYTNIFQPLQWHEDRAPEDMPEYLRLIQKSFLTAEIIEVGAVVKVLNHFSYSSGEPNNRGCQIFGNDFLAYFKTIPANREEYESYLKEKENK
jgi:hypothetical protein